MNAGGTLSLLEAAREFCPQFPFIHMSTNKVCGDAPNEIALIEKETRWDYTDPNYASGVLETFRIDQSKHSIFGASKLAADILEANEALPVRLRFDRPYPRALPVSRAQRVSLPLLLRGGAARRQGASFSNG